MSATSLVLALLVALTALTTAAPRPATATATTAPGRPNVVVVMVDDLSTSDLASMRRVDELLTRQGTTFTRFYVSSPECCPSRATYLTGQYLHNHGVLTNLEPTGGYYHLDHGNTLPVWLQANGYRTAHVGKYLNLVGTVDPTDRPAGWDDYYGLVDPTTYRYWNYTVNHNGVLETHGTATGEYSTDVLAAHAVQFLEQQAGSTEPFFLSFAPLATHAGTVDGTGPSYPVPATRHNGTLTGVAQPRTANFNEADVSDKPSFIRSLAPLTALQQQNQQNWYRQTIETAQAADEAVGTIVDTLTATGQLDDTVIVFVSDNGMLRGEHRVRLTKAAGYDEAVRVPLIIRGPGFPAGGRVTTLTSMVDVAPTIAELTGTTPGRTVDGISVLPMLTDGRYAADRSLLTQLFPLPGRLAFRSVRGPRWKYVEYSTGEQELYDLWADPNELVNRAGAPALASLQAALAARLAALASCSGATCR